MDSPSGTVGPSGKAARRGAPQEVGKAGYVVTNEMYNTLYHLYYQQCVRQRRPCLVVVRQGGHCRIDLDLTCSHHELTEWAMHSLREVFDGLPVDEFYADEVYFWATRVPNRLAEKLAREVLTLLSDERAMRAA
jgi:hypothetical protein